MSSFGTGVTIVTACWEGRAHGMTVNSLTSVSLDPCLLLVCIKNGSGTGLAIKRNRRLGVSVLGRDQQEICRAYGGARDGRLEDRLTDMTEGVPLVCGALAGMVCELHEVVPGGDHEILIGRVRLCNSHEGAPLLFFRGAFGGFDALDRDNGAAVPTR